MIQATKTALYVKTKIHQPILQTVLTDWILFNYYVDNTEPQ